MTALEQSVSQARERCGETGGGTATLHEMPAKPKKKTGAKKAPAKKTTAKKTTRRKSA
ncbi:hypothetical protein ACF064_36035 [Streptomyces sp. NPDC015492]|uniref:hypothetical protein n=1 Tax=Streptomyces sp. NPDC015492 TaxID=3364958 RepID=UPI0036FE44AB